ncbi:hypothetical protein Dimus_021361 [Dionaea muscipula]
MRNPSSSSPTNPPATTTTSTPCCIKVGLKRGPWTPEEDELLVNYIKGEGEGRWRTLPKRAGLLRCGKSCRLRWMNYLRPSVKRGQIAPDEEDLILRLHRLLGNRWSLIAGRIPGRTDNEIKNYWNTHLSKKLISKGIDPRTHKPLADVDIGKPSSSNKPNNIAVYNSLPATTAAGASPPPNPNPGLNLQAPADDSPSKESNVKKSSSHAVAQQKHMVIVNSGKGSNDTGNGIVLINGNNMDVNLRGRVHDGFGMGLILVKDSNNAGDGYYNNNGSDEEEEEEDEDVNYCSSDEVFSSFLNSLIDEDVYHAAQNYVQVTHQQQQSLPNGNGNGNGTSTIAAAAAGDAMNTAASSTDLQTAFGFGGGIGSGWDAPLMSAAASANFNNQNIYDHSKRLNGDELLRQ